MPTSLERVNADPDRRVSGRIWRRSSPLAVFVGIALAMIGWAMATPLGGSPDEPVHMIKAAAVVRGELIGEPTDAAAITRVTVPGTIAIARSWPCFAFNSTASAACQGPFDASSRPVQTRTSAGLYDPVYYALVGWPSLVLTGSEPAAYAMRIVSALLSAAFLTAAVVTLRRLVPRIVLAASTMAALTPMVLFLGGAVNPNAFEVATGAAFTAGLLAATREGASGPVLALIAVSGVLLANARGISLLWMALIVVAVLVMTPWPRLRELFARWPVRVTILVLALGVGIALAWTLTTGTLQSMGTYPGAGTVSAPTAFATMLFTRTIDAGIVGVFGWLDTLAPPLTYAVNGGLLIFVAVLAVVVARGRRLVAVAITLSGVLLVPALLQAASITRSGYIWQGRYALVAVVAAVFVAAIVISDEKVVWDRPILRRLMIAVSVLVVVGQLNAFAWTLNRYIVGLDGSSFAFIRGGEWLPPGGSILWLAVEGVGLVLVFGALAGRGRQSERTPQLAGS